MRSIKFALLICSFILLNCLNAQHTSATYIITNGGGGTHNYAPTAIPDVFYVTGTGANLGSDFILSYSSIPAIGTSWSVYTNLGVIGLAGHNFTFFGFTLTADQLPGAGVVQGTFRFEVVKNGAGAASLYATYSPSYLSPVLGTGLNGGVITDGTLSLSAIDTVGAGRILMGNTSNTLTSQLIGGDFTLAGTGAATISSGVITNGKVSSSAAIDRTKLGAGSVNQVVINDGSGNFSSEATLNPSRGGLGNNYAGANGFVRFSSGSSVVGNISDLVRITVSFDTLQYGVFYINFPYPCTVTNAQLRVTEQIAGADNGSILFQNNSGTAMAGGGLTAGVISVASGATVGSGYATTITGNNTFTAGQNMLITPTKPTKGGALSIDITITRIQ